MATKSRPRTPMWKAGVKPSSKRYSEGGKLKTKSNAKKKSA